MTKNSALHPQVKAALINIIILSILTSYYQLACEHSVAFH